MKKCFLIVVAVLMLCSCQQSVPVYENSQWRGENRDGIYNETGLLKSWAVDGPELLWSYEGLGAGYSSVAVAGGKIYITGLEEDDLILFVFDFAGNLLTRKVVGKEWTENFVGPRSTVVVNDGKLYIANSLGQLFCLDETTLNEIWSKDGHKDFDGRNIRFGVTENPVIVGDKIFLTPGGEKNNMIALNKNTGALIWSSPGTGTVSTYGSPLFIGDQSVPMIVNYLAGDQLGEERIFDNKIVAFHANTGEVLWSYSQQSGNTINPNTPIYNDGHIFFSTGYRGGSLLLRLTNGGRSVEEVWNNPADNQHHGPVKVGDYVYTTSHANRAFFCIDWKTGETKWTEEHRQASMVYADGLLYAYDEGGGMSLIKPNTERFDLVSRFEITLGTDQHWAHPVIYEGVMYIRHGDVLMAYRVKN